MEKKYILEIKDVKKSYKNIEVLKGIHAKIKEKEIVALIGASGSGKSTLLRCIANLERIDNGEIIYGNGNDPLKVGMVFQQFNLFPHYTALENISKPLITVNKMNKKEAIEKSLRLLEKIKLVDKKDNYPNQLSGGQQQRVAIARALAMNPKIMLFDEPTSALDPELSHEVFSTIKDLARENITMILVTHDMNFAKEIADRVLFMDEGKIIEEGTAKELFNFPKNKRTLAFLEKVK